MRGFTLLVAAMAINTLAAAACAAGPIRFAQTSTVTNCMMACNSQGSTCQSACVVAPSAAPTTATAPNTNATASSTCLLRCSTLQLACHTACAQQSPSQ